MTQLNKKIWCYQAEVQDGSSITEIELWLGQLCGTFRNRWHVVYQHDRTVFFFRQAEDALLFKLRWL